MSEQKSDPHAFPYQTGGGWAKGMTLRDWFAGQALAVGGNLYADTAAAAKQCYDMADAMLKERQARS